MRKMNAFMAMAALCLVINATAQSVGVGTTTPNSSSQLEVSSTTKGTLLTRMTTAQRKAITTPAVGLLVYDLDKQCLYLYDGSNWNPLAFTNDAQLPAISRTLPDLFPGFDGVSVDIDGSYAVVGASGASDNGINSCGAVYVFQQVNSTWELIQKLIAGDASNYLNLGSRVAIKGNYIIASTPFSDVSSTTEAGAVYVFKNGGGTWAQLQKITRAAPVAFDHFGFGVDVDGNYLVISAMDDGSGQGDAYVYQTSGSYFTLVATLVPAGLTATERYGSAISIANNKIVVGAPYNTYSSKTGAGACYAFNLNGGTWSYSYKITAANSAAGDHFGTSLALSYDAFWGAELFVGAPDKTYLTYTGAGAVYGFSLTNTQAVAGPMGFSPSAKSDMHFGSSICYRRGKLAVVEIATLGAKGNVFLYDAASNYGGFSSQQRLQFVSNPESSTYNSSGIAIFGNNIIVGFVANDKIYFKNIE